MPDASWATDAVPTVVLADTEGVVRWSYLGAPAPADVTEALQDVGALPPPGAGETAVDFG